MKSEQQLQLVSFEQAQRLKKAGFDWKTPGLYPDFDVLHFTVTEQNRNDEIDTISAPTVALVLKWFRNVKNIPLCVYCGWSLDADEICYYFNYYHKGWKVSYDKVCDSMVNPPFDTYELAESALLDELLTLIEKQ